MSFASLLCNTLPLSGSVTGFISSSPFTTAPLSLESPFHIEALNTDSPQAETLAKLGYDTFYETFGPHQEAEVIQPYLDKAFAVELIQSELSDPNNRFFLASNPQGEAVAYAKLVFQPLETHACLSSEQPIMLNRLYVRQPAQGTGLAVTLLNLCVETAREAGGTSLWLGVWRNNPRAIRFYEKHGFKVMGTRWFQMGPVLEPDHIMERPL